MTATLPISAAACWLIRAYQQYVSPNKGFRCAYGLLHGRDSCSRFASRAVERRGVSDGARLTSRRFEKCRWASHILDYDRAKQRRDRRERTESCVNGWNPTCDGGDAAESLGDVALQGACEAAAGACHW